MLLLFGCFVAGLQLALRYLHDCTAYWYSVELLITAQERRGNSDLLMQIEQKHCAFVTFTSRQAAETAAEALSNRLIIKGNRCRLLWGKPQQKRDESAAATASMLPSQVCIC